MSKFSCIPKTVFVCGAVGSGNTFMFNCLTQDGGVYGVNEDALGATLFRLINSEKEMGKCPHSVAAFDQFINALRGSRRTLVLKTPSNLRHAKLILQHFPDSHFIKMLREPHAAITSGIDRHAVDSSIELNATRWRDDFRDIVSLNDSSSVVTFEDLACDPISVLKGLSHAVMPLSEEVFLYAKRMHRPERADTGRWEKKVDASTRDEIKHWVQKMGLIDLYRSVAEGRGHEASLQRESSGGAQKSTLVRSVDSLKKQFYRIHYRFWK